MKDLLKFLDATLTMVLFIGLMVCLLFSAVLPIVIVVALIKYLSN